MNPDQQNPYGQPIDPGQQPQQAANGQYEVVPPLPAGQNNGHSGHNPYEFIVNPPKPTRPRSSLFGGSGNDGKAFLMRIGLLVGGFVVLLIVAAVIISALGPKGSTSGLTAIAQRQQEIIRVATAATQQASSQDTKNFVANTEFSVTSSQQAVLTYLQNHKIKLNQKQLALDQSAQTDTALANAASANNYDSAVTQQLSSQLQTYEGLLQTTYKQTSSKEVKAMLQGCFTSAVGLLQQAQRLSAELSS